MKFWDNNSAAPTWLNTWDRLLAPGYLRNSPASEPNVPGYKPIRATVANVTELTQFWNLFYRGADWRTELSEKHVLSYLDDKRVYVVILVNAGRIVASIVSSPFSLIMSHGGTCTNARIIEGLVVHPFLRGKGIAGLLIAYMDYLTSKNGPVCHLWAREETVPSMFSSALSQLSYSYILPETIKKREMSVEKITWIEYLAIKPWRRTNGQWIRGASPQNRRDDLDVWREVKIPAKPEIYVIITNTRRIELKTNRPIYEVIWCSDTPPPGLLESIAIHYDGPVFTTLPESVLSSEWQKGRSGYHSWYIYNYLPPAFGNCSVELIREEL